MSSWVPPGYACAAALVRERGLDEVRSDLFSGRLAAFRWDAYECALMPMEPMIWLSRNAEEWLASGIIRRHGNDDCQYTVIVRAAGEEAKPQLSTDGAYLPPFMQLMLDAIRLFDITEDCWPKKEELERHFRAQKLPDGTPISANLASQLATLCRPPAAKRGGNKKG